MIREKYQAITFQNNVKLKQIGLAEAVGVYIFIL